MYKIWYTVINNVNNNAIFSTISKQEVINYLKDKDINIYSIQTVKYLPIIKNVAAKEFLES